MDAVPYSDPNNYVRFSGRLAEELAKDEPNGAIWANQFDNAANRQAHVETTGPEIWAQTEGKIDGFICAVGTGGTLAGVAQALRERKPDIAIGSGRPGRRRPLQLVRPWRTQGRGQLPSPKGIGQGRITANLEGLKIDYPLPDPGRGNDAGRSSISRRTKVW